MGLKLREALRYATMQTERENIMAPLRTPVWDFTVSHKITELQAPYTRVMLELSAFAYSYMPPGEKHLGPNEEARLQQALMWGLYKGVALRVLELSMKLDSTFGVQYDKEVKDVAHELRHLAQALQAGEDVYAPEAFVTREEKAAWFWSDPPKSRKDGL